RVGQGKVDRKLEDADILIRVAADAMRLGVLHLAVDIALAEPPEIAPALGRPHRIARAFERLRDKPFMVAHPRQRLQPLESAVLPDDEADIERARKPGTRKGGIEAALLICPFAGRLSHDIEGTTFLHAQARRRALRLADRALPARAKPDADTRPEAHVERLRGP